MAAESRRDPPQPKRIAVNGVGLSYFEWRASRRGHGPTLLFVHATGFHARVWDEVIARLPDHHVISLDQRGHGRSERTEITGWPVFGQDLAAFVDALDLNSLLGVGHSMGAHALVQACAYRPERFERLVLVDPVIAAPAAYHAPPPFKEGEVHPAARRQSRFESAAAMLERFRTRMPYSLFSAASLADYCEHGLRPAEDGEGFELACAPITEARIYMTGRANGSVYASVRAVRQPVLIVRAKLPTPDRNPFDYSFSPTWPGLVSEFHHAREVHLPAHSHFAPMEDPARIAGLIQEELGQGRE